ncbi:unnamed protein product, partial [Ectocarpus sp. 8 AP-2014]
GGRGHSRCQPIKSIRVVSSCEKKAHAQCSSKRTATKLGGTDGSMLDEVLEAVLLRRDVTSSSSRITEARVECCFRRSFALSNLHRPVTGQKKNDLALRLQTSTESSSCRPAEPCRRR